MKREESNSQSGNHTPSKNRKRKCPQARKMDLHPRPRQPPSHGTHHLPSLSLGSSNEERKDDVHPEGEHRAEEERAGTKARRFRVEGKDVAFGGKGRKRVGSLE